MDWAYVGGRKGPQVNMGIKGGSMFTIVKKRIKARLGHLTWDTVEAWRP